MPATTRTWIGRAGPAIGLVLVVLAFTLLSGAPERYLSPFNLRIVLSQSVIVAVGAIGMTMIVVSGGIDLSVGAAIALTGVITAIGLTSGLPPSVAVFAAILGGGVIGTINGLAITTLRVIPFIVTLGMLGVARGVAKWLAHE